MLIQRTFLSGNKKIWIVIDWHGAYAPCVILCPGLGMTKSQAKLSLIAQHCHDQGLNVFRFDEISEGISDGDFTDVSLEVSITILQDVIHFVRELTHGCIGLISFDAGNILLCHVCSKLNIDTLALIDPDFNTSSSYQGIYKDILSFPGPTLLITGDNLTLYDTYRTIQEQRAAVETVAISNSEYSGNPKNIEAWRTESLIAAVASWSKNKLLDISLQQAPSLSESTPLFEHKYHYSRGKQTCAYPFSFEVNNNKVLGILHVPSSDWNGKRQCVIYQHGLGGNRIDTYRCAPRLAHTLAMAGSYVLRYDNRSSGVSEGRTYEFTWTRCIEDLSSALEKLSFIDGIDMENIIVVSNSAGAKIACITANRFSNIRGCVLWSPVLTESVETDISTIASAPSSGRARFQKHSSGNLVTQYLDNIWLGIKYFADEKKYDFFEEFKRCQKPMLIVFASDDAIIDHRQKDVILQVVSQQKEKSCAFFSGGHQFSYDGMGEVIEYTKEWIRRLTQTV